MKTLLATLVLLASAASLADDPATNPAPVVVAQTLFEDGTTNSWTQTDLTDALGLMNRKYHRDIESETGRVKWHGKRMGQYLVGEGEDLKLVMLYEDGFAFTGTPQRVAIKDPEAAAKAKAAAEARQAEWERKNLPPDVANLLQRRRDAANGK